MYILKFGQQQVYFTPNFDIDENRRFMGMCVLDKMVKTKKTWDLYNTDDTGGSVV